MIAFWEYAAFLANSVVFIAIGGHEAHQPLSLFTASSAIAIGLVRIGRAVAVYPLCALVKGTWLQVDLRYRHVLVWGGLRGALALALALPETIPERGEIIVVAFAVVAFSIFVQGLSMPWLIRKPGFARARGMAALGIRSGAVVRSKSRRPCPCFSNAANAPMA